MRYTCVNNIPRERDHLSHTYRSTQHTVNEHAKAEDIDARTVRLVLDHLGCCVTGCASITADLDLGDHRQTQIGQLAVA